MKRSLLALVLITLCSCSSKSTDLVVTGSVKGMKKGTIYLQKIIDTALVAVDSMQFDGSSAFELSCELKEPEVLYLNLDDNSTEHQRIRFFADKGVTDVQTTLKRFAYDATITGSSLHQQLEDYNRIAKRFNDARLDLLAEQLEATTSGDTALINKANEKADANLRRKYLYAINFAINHKSSEIAPYIALTEIYDANIKYLDTIYNVLPKNIAQSKYGKELETFIGSRKAEEQ